MIYACCCCCCWDVCTAQRWTSDYIGYKRCSDPEIVQVLLWTGSMQRTAVDVFQVMAIAFGGPVEQYLLRVICTWLTYVRWPLLLLLLIHWPCLLFLLSWLQQCLHKCSYLCAILGPPLTNNSKNRIPKQKSKQISPKKFKHGVNKLLLVLRLGGGSCFWRSCGAVLLRAIWTWLPYVSCLLVLPLLSLLQQC